MARDAAGSFRALPSGAGARATRRNYCGVRTMSRSDRASPFRASRRTVLQLGAASAALTAVAPLFATVQTPESAVSARSPRAFANIPPEGGRVVLDRARYPATFREAPMLAERVRAGQLPPVAERIGL